MDTYIKHFAMLFSTFFFIFLKYKQNIYIHKDFNVGSKHKLANVF